MLLKIVDVAILIALFGFLGFQFVQLLRSQMQFNHMMRQPRIGDVWRLDNGRQVYRITGYEYEITGIRIFNRDIVIGDPDYNSRWRVVRHACNTLDDAALSRDYILLERDGKLTRAGRRYLESMRSFWM